ncbi:MAG TPA: DNA internalization-related competence protein ComEC/Rec2 [Candidatus Onthocola stercorigallinarum]|nr:DNA internalization-related competence protein ComEC/Rec2 [Candidatus Onthocola stercorigallinarum]
MATIVIQYESIYSDDETSITGSIMSYSINGNKLKMNIKDKEEVIATYYIKTEEELVYLKENIGIGKTITVNGTLNEPINNTIPNTFNYKKYLYNNKIYYLFDAHSYNIQNDNNLLDRAKDYLIKRAYNSKNSEYLLVLVLGDKALISSDEYNTYQNNGTSHLLAVSGSHITVILLVLSFFLKKLKEVPKLIIISLILLFFAFVTNNASAVNRAIYFFIINRINKLGNLKLSNIQVLFITAFILLLLDPFTIYDLGFIYSFCISLGIMYYSDKLNGNLLIATLKVSIIAFLFSLPISSYINYEVNLSSILINLIFVPWISYIVFPISIITFIFPIFNPILSILLSITNVLNNIGEFISIFINVPKMPLVVAIILFILLLLAKNNKKYLYVILIILGLIKLSPLINSSYEVYFLDINQGDSAIIITPHKRDVVMIDTGGKITYEVEDWKKGNKTYNLSDNTIKFLKSKGITTIDYLITTHGDYDHLGEVQNIVNKLNVKNVIFNNDSYNTLELELIDVLNDKNIKYCQNIKTLNITNNTIYFLNDYLYDNENDNSNVLYLSIYGNKFLFMGDAGINVEEDLINKYNLENITVLKVGHHGSKTSSSKNFIDYVNPLISVISVGRNNRYNHPSTDVLANLSNRIIYRTDIDGTIKFNIKKNKFDIKTYEP